MSFFFHFSLAPSTFSDLTYNARIRLNKLINNKNFTSAIVLYRESELGTRNRSRLVLGNFYILQNVINPKCSMCETRRFSFLGAKEGGDRVTRGKAQDRPNCVKKNKITGRQRSKWKVITRHNSQVYICNTGFGIMCDCEISVRFVKKAVGVERRRCKNRGAEGVLPLPRN